MGNTPNNAINQFIHSHANRGLIRVSTDADEKQDQQHNNTDVNSYIRSFLNPVPRRLRVYESLDHIEAEGGDDR